MCIVFFQRNPHAKLKFFVLFNRDEMLKRTRGPLELLSDGVVCGIDLGSQGTWFGVNQKNGKIGWLTNYDHKPFMSITDPKYRRGPLIVNYLRSDVTVQEYLKPFLEEGQQYNGTNIALGDKEKMYFAHNYHPGCQL